MTYSPGENAESTFTRALARSTFSAPSVQRRLPSFCTFNMWNGENIATPSYNPRFNHRADSLSRESFRPFGSLWRTRIFSTHQSSRRSVGLGFVINNANRLIQDVIRKVVDCFPNGLVNSGCTSSFCSLFREKLKQPISKNLVSPRYLQRQVRNSLKGVSVRARGPFNVLVRHRFVFQHFKKTAVFCFPLPLSSSYLDQVAHLAAR